LSPSLTVHRGTREIGGSCIEIVSTARQRLILDVGRPLDAGRNATGLLPATLDTSGSATVLISHSHPDHWGLLNETPANWEVRCGEKTAELIRLNATMFGGGIDRPITTWTNRSGTFKVGDFQITPILTDHSAVDAYMLLVEVDGRRILYTGDFRTHGRKGGLVERTITNPPNQIDVLVMEGTNLGTDKPTMAEAELEQAFVDLAPNTPRHIFVYWSAQNADRTATLFRAARRTGRKLVVDLYGAEVLEVTGKGTRLPTPGSTFPEIAVVITESRKKRYTALGKTDFLRRMIGSSFSTSRSRLAKGKAIIMLRDSMVDEFEAGGLCMTPDDAYVFSSWGGYLENGGMGVAWDRAGQTGTKRLRLHTSGHASPADLTRFAKAVAPAAIVPVHGLSWDSPDIDIGPIRRLRDGEIWKIGAGRSGTKH
jgi:ribonuclease J